jgi:hypothetical protein
MKAKRLVFLLAAIIAGGTMASTLFRTNADEAVPHVAPAEPRMALPIDVRLVPNQLFVVGLQSSAQMVITNTTPLAARQGAAMPLQAFVLRGVRWKDGRDDVRRWNTTLYGSPSRGEDGTISHNSMTQQLTNVAFERGLLLPGEQMTVTVPFTPQEKLHTLEVSYAVVGNGADWQQEVLLPQSRDTSMSTQYVPVTMELLEARRKTDGEHRLAMVRATSTPGAAPLPLQTRTFTIQLPLAPDTAFARTGGLSMQQALQQALDRAGSALHGNAYRGSYRPALKSWFFVSSEGKAMALRWEVPPKAPPDTYRWRLHLLPDMDVTAPDDFGAVRDGKTLILLRPDTFADVVKVSKPSTHMYSNPGETELTSAELWRVLARARERNIALKLVTIDPNGLGTEQILSADVKVDASGRWLDPKITPVEQR